MRRELIAYEDPKSHVSELFRTLRTNVQFMNSNRKLRTLLITSTLPGEGKSWISSNLAITFAQADKRVLLIDADMRKCSLHRIFRVASCPGLSNYLAGLNDSNDGTVDFGKFIRETEVPNLYLLPSGNVPPNPSELLASPQMITLLDELKNEFVDNDFANDRVQINILNKTVNVIREVFKNLISNKGDSKSENYRDELLRELGL